MLAATLRVVPDEADDDVGPDLANPVDVVLEDLVAVPALVGLVTAERETEVHRAREVLLGAVDPVRREQLLGTQHGQRLEDLRADLVLTTVAACGRDQRRPHPALEPVLREQRVVLVVGVGSRHHQAADGAELPDDETECRDVGMFPDRLEAVLRMRRHSQCQQQQRRAGDAGHESEKSV